MMRTLSTAILAALSVTAAAGPCRPGSPALRLANACYAGGMRDVTSRMRFDARGCAGTLTLNQDAPVTGGGADSNRRMAGANVDVAKDLVVRIEDPARPARGLASVDPDPRPGIEPDLRAIARQLTLDARERIRRASAALDADVAPAAGDDRPRAIASCADALDRYDAERARANDGKPPRARTDPTIRVERGLGTGNVPQILRRPSAKPKSGSGR